MRVINELWCVLPAETWVYLPDCDGLYMVSNLGRIRSTVVKDRILSGTIDKDGYKRVRLSFPRDRVFRVHRLVCGLFNGPPPSPQHEVGHLDGNRLNNASINLAWVTKSENAAHKIIHGTHQAGERHPRAKITYEQVNFIRASTEPHRALARRLGIHESTIRQIRKGDRW